MDTLITGATFGASLVISGMFSPSLIASQFSFEKSNMLQTFLTATGSSAVVIELLRRLGQTVPQPRSWSSAGIIPGSPLDGNLLGGLLLGAGMSLSSSCPAMAFPQAILGIPSAPTVIAGGAVGGIFWSAVLRPWIAARRKGMMASATARQQQQQQQQSPPITLADVFGFDHTTTLFLFEAVLICIVTVMAATATSSAPSSSSSSSIHPVVGGLIIGGAQLVSLLLRGSLLGVSTCYEQLGDWVVHLARGRRNGIITAPDPGTSAMLFSAAMVAGAGLLASVWPESTLMAAATAAVRGASSARAFAGGFLMAVGSRMAGGCASGHGISGIALMSTSSLVTMFATFAAAAVVSMFSV